MSYTDILSDVSIKVETGASIHLEAIKRLHRKRKQCAARPIWNNHDWLYLWRCRAQDCGTSPVGQWVSMKYVVPLRNSPIESESCQSSEFRAKRSTVRLLSSVSCS